MAQAEAEIVRLGAIPKSSTVPDIDAVLAAAPSWYAMLLGASIPSQRRVLSYLIRRVAPTRLGYARYDVRITWTEAGAWLREMSAALTT